MIKIWDFANHVHHIRPHEKESCNCRHYLNLCIHAAREQWREDYIYFDTAIYRFQFNRKELVDMMSTYNEIFLEHLVRCYIRDVRFFLRNNGRSLLCINPCRKIVGANYLSFYAFEDHCK